VDRMIEWFYLPFYATVLFMIYVIYSDYWGC
jgi:hypothetical protein